MQLVAALWSNTAATQGAPLSPSPAQTAEGNGVVRPRAPSLLLPARAPREAPPGADARVPQTDAPSANDPGAEDSLAERLNRELQEQAWLRGVDLT
jgi:hypothetical protein